MHGKGEKFGAACRGRADQEIDRLQWEIPLSHLLRETPLFLPVRILHNT